MSDANDEVCLTPQEAKVLSALTSEFKSFPAIAKAVGVSIKRGHEKPLTHRQHIEELRRVLASLIRKNLVVRGVMFQARNVVEGDYDLYGYKLLPRSTQ